MAGWKSFGVEDEEDMLPTVGRGDGIGIGVGVVARWVVRRGWARGVSWLRSPGGGIVVVMYVGRGREAGFPGCSPAI